MELGHLLARSGLTYPEVSSKVYHDSFCQFRSSISLPWVIYFEAWLYSNYCVISKSCLLCCIYAWILISFEELGKIFHVRLFNKNIFSCIKCCTCKVTTDTYPQSTYHREWQRDSGGKINTLGDNSVNHCRKETLV